MLIYLFLSFLFAMGHINICVYVLAAPRVLVLTARASHQQPQVSFAHEHIHAHISGKRSHSDNKS